MIWRQNHGPRSDQRDPIRYQLRENTVCVFLCVFVCVCQLRENTVCVCVSVHMRLYTWIVALGEI